MCKQLKRYRLSRKLKIQDVAKLSGLSTGAISNLENGKVRPNLKTIDTLAKAYGISIHVIIDILKNEKG